MDAPLAILTFEMLGFVIWSITMEFLTIVVSETRSLFREVVPIKDFWEHMVPI